MTLQLSTIEHKMPSTMCCNQLPAVLRFILIHQKLIAQSSSFFLQKTFNHKYNLHIHRFQFRNSSFITFIKVEAVEPNS